MEVIAVKYVPFKGVKLYLVWPFFESCTSKDLRSSNLLKERKQNIVCYTVSYKLK